MGVRDRLKRALRTSDGQVGAEEFITYRCTCCGGRFRAKHQLCPECGGDTLLEEDGRDSR